jgi:hypothetical protein
VCGFCLLQNLTLAVPSPHLETKMQSDSKVALCPHAPHGSICFASFKRVLLACKYLYLKPSGKQKGQGREENFLENVFVYLSGFVP